MSTKQTLSFNKIRTTFFFGLIIILGITVLYLFRPFIYPIFWASIIAVMFYPLFQMINKRVKSPVFSSSLSVVAVIVILLLPLTLITTLLVNESIGLYQTVASKDLARALSNASQWVENTPFASYAEVAQKEWPAYVSQATQAISIYFFTSIRSITENSVRFLFLLFVMFYALYFFFKDGVQILQRLMHLSPLGDIYETMLYQRFTSTTRATLKSTLIVGGIQGMLSGTLFFITGIQGALVWAVIMTILSIIPAVGPAIILIPTAIVMLVLGNMWQGVVLLIGTFVVSFIDNLIRPPLLGKDIEMHPLMVFFSTLGGLMLFGISGFIIGPIIAALFLSVISIYDHYFQHELKNN